MPGPGGRMGGPGMGGSRRTPPPPRPMMNRRRYRRSGCLGCCVTAFGMIAAVVMIAAGIIAIIN